MIAKVLEILQQEGYRVIPPPLKIVDVDFHTDFPAVLVGPGNQQSLIVVLDSSRTPVEVARRRIKALATTLDRSGSEIPLTLVLITSQSDASKTEDFDVICRVVRVFDATDPRHDLRTLLPLVLPEPAEPLPSALPTLLKKIGTPAEDHFETTLAELAPQGRSAVSDAVRNTIDKIVHQYLDGGTK